jgi:hypothetical protein
MKHPEIAVDISNLPPTTNLRSLTESMTEILIQPDGSILAHNITPAMAEVMLEICPEDSALRQRVQAQKLSKNFS